jgi:alkylation response protein AidB-like acyl-CoA dehydrogenase
MDFQLSKEQELIQKTARDFAEKYVLPVAEQIDRENKVPPEIYRKMSELELFGIPFSEDFGGTGAGYSCYPLAVEQVAKASGGVALTLSVNTLGISAMNIFGTPDQKKRYMVPCCRGEKIASFAFTEPGTGSDPKQITSTAVKDGDSYILNGTKRFISAADLPGPIVIFAKDDETNLPTGFIVEKFCPGYSISEPWHKIGMRGGMMVDVYVKDVRVPATDMLGPKGQGYLGSPGGDRLRKGGSQLGSPRGNAVRP